jgi:hypothetical protein
MPTVLKSGNLNLLELSGPVQACNGVALLLLYPPSGYDSVPFNSVQSVKTRRLNGTGPIKKTRIYAYTSTQTQLCKQEKPKTDKIVRTDSAAY